MLSERFLVGKMKPIGYLNLGSVHATLSLWDASLVGLCLCLLAALTNSGEARAGTVTGSLPVQVTMAACTVNNSSSLTFSTTEGTSLTLSQVTQTGSISVTYDSSPYSIGLDSGQNASSGQRRMAHSTNYISYNVYLDSAHTEPWTTATSSTCTGTNTCYLGTGNGSAQTVNVYGVGPDGSHRTRVWHL